MTTHDNADYGKPASLLTAGEVAEILRVSEPTIRNLRRRGELRYARIGGKVLFRGVDVDAYVESKIEGGPSGGSVRPLSGDQAADGGGVPVESPGRVSRERGDGGEGDGADSAVWWLVGAGEGSAR